MNLPEGFTLEQQAPSLPEGFKLEEPKQQVNLPEGFKLEAVPDELGRYDANKQPNQPARAGENDSDFIRGIQAYLPQTKELYYGAKTVLGAGLQKVVGKGEFTDDMIKSGLEGIKRAQDEQAPLSKETDSASKAWDKGIGTFLTDYLPYMAGQGVANAAESLLTASVGAGVGAVLGEGVGAVPGAAVGLLEKSLIKAGVKEAAQKIAKEKGEEAAQKYVVGAATKLVQSTGGKVAMVGQAGFHGVGEVGSRAIEEMQNRGEKIEDLDFGRLIPAMAVHAGADFIANRIGLSSLDGIGASGKNLIYDIAQNMVMTGVKEVPPELAQQLAERFGAKLNLADADAMHEYMETVVGAFVQPSVTAGLGGVKGHMSARADRNNVKEILKKDFESKGETPTDKQLNKAVDTFIKARSQEEDKGDNLENTGNDTGADQSGISVSEEEGRESEAPGGVGGPAAGGVGGNQGPATTPGMGEGEQQGALTREEAEAKIQEFQDKKAALLTKTGKIPLANSKKGREYQALVAEEEAFIKARENAPIIQSAQNDFKGEISRANLQTVQNLEQTVGKEAADVYLNELKRLEAAQNQEPGTEMPSGAPAVPTTPEFEEHFKESKVRDENGRMLPLYHGTTATNQDKGISQFKVSKEGSLGEGVYMTPKTGFSNSYAGSPTPEEIDAMEAAGLVDPETISKLRAALKTGELAPGQVGGNVLPVFADLRNPLIIHTNDRARDPGVALLEALGVPTEKAEAIMEKAYETKGGLTKEVSSRARKQGYDGIMQYKNGVLSEVVAFSPLDIKSAMNQKPTRMAGISNSESTSPRAGEILPGDMLNQGLHPEVEQAISNGSLDDVLKFYRNNGGKFVSAFAKRLSELGLTTRMYFDREIALSEAYINRVKDQKERVFVYLQANYPDSYKKYFEPVERTFGPYDPQAVEKLAYYFSFMKLNGLVIERNGARAKADLKPIETELYSLAKVYSGIDRISKRGAGAYYGLQDAININTKLGGNRNSTVLHEITHAATHFATHNPKKLDEKQTRALGNLNNLYISAKAKLKAEGKGDYYGLTSLDEFISEAFSNPEFQKELRKLKTGLKSDQTMWSKFIQLVAQLLGSDNVLFHTIANADIIFSANKGSVALPVANELSDESTAEMPSVSHGLKDFKLNPGERGEGGIFNYIKKAIKGKISWKDLNKENFGNFLDNVNDNYRQYLLGGLTLDQLTDMAGEDIPQFKTYVKEVDAMIATRNKIMAEGDKPIKAWTALIRDNPAKATQLSRMMIEATINKVDPDPKGIGHNAADLAAHPEIQKAWNDMTTGKDGDIAKQIYREVRGFYERRMDEYVAIQQQRLIEREQAKGTDAKEIDRLVIEQRKEIQKDIIQPYFPIKRFGEYWVQVGSGKGKTFMQFENAGARNAAIQQMRQHMFKQLGITKNSTPEEIKEAEAKFALEARAGEGFTELSQASLSDVSQLGKLKERIDAVSADIAADPNAVGKEINSLRDALKDSLDQYVLEITPNQSIRKMFLHRNNIQGASEDMLRAFAESRYRIAYQRSRFEHMPQLFRAVEAARLSLKNMPHNRRTSLNRALVRELELNLKSGVLEPPKVEGWVRHLTQFGFLHFLTSPASAVINMMAVPSIYVPFARARFGTRPVMSTLAKYTKLLGGTGYVNEKTGRYEFLSLARSKLNEMPLLDKDGNKVMMDKMDDDGVITKVPMTYADAYEKGVLLQAIDTTLSHESASIGDQPSEDYTGRFQKFMYYASLPFHAAEKFNRETTYMTTFELAYKKYISDTKNPYTPQMAFEKASQDARDLVQKTMFNYNTINKPRYFRGNIASLVLQFKMYPQQMTVLMARTFYQSIGRGMEHDLEAYKQHIKNSPDYDNLVAQKEAELKAIRQEATESFWGMMGMTFITAGISGLPLFFILSGIASAFHAVFGDTDEPFDFDNWFKNWCSRTFGGMVGDTISRGALSQITGANFADRMSINMSDMWFPNVKKSQDEVQYLQNVMTNLMGPVMGAGLGYAEALKRLNDGHYERAMESMLPAGLKNVFVGTRYLVEGKALTLKGDTLDQHISAKEAVGQMLGFSPEDTAQKQKAAMEKKNFDLEIQGRKQDLENAFFIAFDSNDSRMQDRVLGKVMRFNNTNPEYAIDADALISSIKKRYTQRALSDMAGGVSITKKAMGRLAGMSDYAKD
jgi:hypothetical protein